MLKLAAGVFLIALFTGSSFAQDVNLKKQSEVIFKDGLMFVVDTYSREKLAIENAQITISVLQTKNVINNQSCGALAGRIVRISSNSRNADLREAQFDEFVAAVNYFTSYRDVWDGIDRNKGKILHYQFNKKPNADEYSGLFRMTGDRETLSMTLQESSNVVFSTKDLRVMSNFSDAVNSVKRFVGSYKFLECL